MACVDTTESIEATKMAIGKMGTRRERDKSIPLYLPNPYRVRSNKPRNFGPLWGRFRWSCAASGLLRVRLTERALYLKDCAPDGPLRLR